MMEKLMDFLTLSKNLKKDFSGFKSVKLAVLGDSPTQLLTQAIKGYGYECQIHIDILDVDYNQIERQILDQSSELYQFDPQYSVVFYSLPKMMQKFYQLSYQEKQQFADHEIEKVQQLYRALTEQGAHYKMLYFNVPEINDGVFGHYANKAPTSFLYQLRKFNYELMNISQKLKNLFIVDLCALQNHYGDGRVCDHRNHINTGMVFSMDFLPVIAKNITDIVQVLSGKFKKCLILDLDNTVWGGIIGDDGMENIQIGDLGIGKAFSQLQLWVKQLKERGILLVICSKNEEQIAKEPFEKHPDMILRLDDFALVVVNWNNKAENIRYIQEVLNIGFDAMVFLDDSPFERAMVKTNVPEITVPELPEDPADYLPYLQTLNLFETASYLKEDAEKTYLYQEQAQRTEHQQAFINEDDFLKDLNMVAATGTFDKFTVPRVAQLTQRSNQFNLRTIRYTEEEIRTIAASREHFTLTFSLKDKFGDNGLISIIILKRQNDTLFIDTWIMSCRVLKRGVECLVMNTIAQLAQKNYFKKIVGEYIATPKNALVKDHYATLGFSLKDNFWVLNCDDYHLKKHFINV